MSKVVSLYSANTICGGASKVTYCCNWIKVVNLRPCLRLEDSYVCARDKKKMAQLRGTDVELHPLEHARDA